MCNLNNSIDIFLNGLRVEYKYKKLDRYCFLVELEEYSHG